MSIIATVLSCATGSMIFPCINHLCVCVKRTETSTAAQHATTNGTATQTKQNAIICNNQFQQLRKQTGKDQKLRSSSKLNEHLCEKAFKRNFYE
ncbi:conserved hypothetical protein [Trichinella spiralis]|uniref:hypothetical protein n=1 Tax=Trichinella spiralis TaxID=6334 RepID=UPI0001EFBF2F|nr:conserved hypothetical protein [Trichinella spiralis]